MPTIRGASGWLVPDVDLVDRPWFEVLTRPLPVGTPTESVLEVPQSDAQRILRAVVRLVADLPVDSTPEVVWTAGGSEMLVHTDRTTITCSTGLLRVGVRVECDQTDGPVTITVPFAVGTAQQPSGLVMQTYDRLAGPEAVTAVWSDALVAFAWESVLETSRRLCAEVGTDTRGRSLVPGTIGAGSRVLLLHPMARHDLRLRPVT